MCTTCGCSGHTHTSEHHEVSSESRLIAVEKDLMDKNSRYAQQNRDKLSANKTHAFNLVSSPGSGKTTLLTTTICQLNQSKNIVVIEGDQQTENDARRIKETGIEVIQINTGKGCHLDAHSVGHALNELLCPQTNYLFIENVGNLVCPAAFDLGELAKVLVLSVTEGDDKPLKYPDMFAAAALLIINKIDLLPYVDFNVDRCIEYARRINPNIQTIQLSATTGDGMQQWLDWLSSRSEQRSPLRAPLYEKQQVISETS